MNIDTYFALSQLTSQWRRGHTEYRSARHREYAHASLFGEAGELVGIVKKATFSGHDLDRAKFTEEAGDVAWSIACVADAYDLPLWFGVREQIAGTPLERFIGRVSSCVLRAQSGLLGPHVVGAAMTSLETLCHAHDVGIVEVFDGNIAKLRKRYPDGYSDAASIARADVTR